MPTTHLQTEGIIPWAKTAALGIGVAAPSGELLAQAVEPFKVTAGDARTEDVHLYRFETEDDVQSLLSVTASAGFNAACVAASASTRFERSVDVSEKSLTLLCTATITWQDGGVVSPLPKLDHDAHSMLHHHPEKFRDAYGDYFIAGYTKKAILSVFARMSAVDREALTTVAAEASAKLTGTVSGHAEAATDLAEYARSKKVTITIDVYKDGVRDPAAGEGAANGTGGCFGLTLEDVPKHVEDFADRAVGAKTEALLVHYHRVDASIPTAIELDHHVFEQAQDLYDRLLFAKVLAKQLPANYKDEHSSDLRRLERSIQTEIPRDLSCPVATVHRFIDQLEQWISRAQLVEDYRKLWRTMLTVQGEGITAWPGPALISELPPQTVTRSYNGPGWVTGYMTFDQQPADPAKGWKVCGFQKISRRDNNGNCTVDSGGLGQDAIVFRCESKYDRGTSWTTRVWTVPAAMVRFVPGDL